MFCNRSTPPSQTVVRFAPLPGSRRNDQVPPLTASRERIEDLCTALRTHHSKPGCLGFLEAQDSRHYLHAVACTRLQGSVQTSASLRSLIAVPSSTAPFHIQGRNKYELAAVLAAAVLHLGSTPWLNGGWNSDHIHFIPAEGEQFASRCVFLPVPFDSPAYPKPGVSTRVQRDFVRNETVFALGLVLIELSLGREVLSKAHMQASDLSSDGQPTLMTEFSIATRLIKDVGKFEGERYQSVAHKCIWGAFRAIESDLTDRNFAKEFFEHVVMPLREVRDDFVR